MQRYSELVVATVRILNLRSAADGLFLALQEHDETCALRGSHDPALNGN